MKKKAIFSLVAALMVVAACTSAMAQNSCGENLYWSVSNDTLYITGEGAMWNYELKETVTYYPEEGITEYTYKTSAPWVDETFTHVSFPAGITSIGEYAFYELTGITSIDLSDCAALDSIGQYAFGYCTGLASLDLSDCTELTSIGYAAFILCYNLESLDLSGCTKLTSIEMGAFADCYSLASLDLSVCTELTSIGDYVFNSCLYLASLKLPNSLTSIGYAAFALCYTLESLDLSACTELTSIGPGAFYQCFSLASLDLPESLTEIDYMAFGECTKLATMTVRATDPPILGSEVFANNISVTCYVPCAKTYCENESWSSYDNFTFVSLDEGKDCECDSSDDSAKLDTVSLSGKLFVYGREVVHTLEAGTQVSVYLTDGRLLLQTTEQRFALPEAGTYIITAGAEAVTVVVR